MNEIQNLQKNSVGLNEAFNLADEIITKNYLGVLQDCEIVSPDSSIINTPVYKSSSVFRIKKIVYDKEENNLQKLVNTYSATVGYSNGLAMIVKSTGKQVEIYLGCIGNDGVSESRTCAKAFANNLSANFPGSLGNEGALLLDNEPLQALMESSLTSSFASVSSVSGIGSLRAENDIDNENYIQSIEKLIDSMADTPFSAIIIANAISDTQIGNIKAEYEMLYSSLVPFAKSELTYSESVADGVSKTLSNSFSETVTNNHSTSLSVGTTESKTNTTAHTDTITNTKSVSVPFGKLFSAGVSRSKSRSDTVSNSTTFGTTNTNTQTVGKAISEGKQHGISDGISHTDTTGKSIQLSYENKTVTQLLEKIDEQLERIKEIENYGVFATAGYFFASTPVESKMAASSYKSLINGINTHIENTKINTWSDPNALNQIKEYIGKLHHPQFKLGDNIVSPATIVSGRELAVHMSLPKRSLPGVSVVETAAFGRNVIDNSNRKGDSITIGNLYHMGREDMVSEEKIPVNIDVQSLAMHTFITGSTGSGKSNAVYSLLEKVLDLNDEGKEEIKFMVIEPAKGEYKDKFGSRKDVTVYGSNPKKTELLRINPFSFPDDIHILEHVDRLIEIFNVCWPMYAAMPAVLKDAIVKSYVNTGWNLNTSECKYKNSNNNQPLYPCFADVLYQINNVMDQSDYSSDSKGDYKGALCTRVKSLTNGINGQIFTSCEIQPNALFDNNAIVDLSRIGSTETKSLIMGILVMKMQEYRMSNHNENNSKLRHIMVLEEAHNLLKKTSTEQSSDGSNMLGKSVEMLSNSIAEMRTYGEGFVIVDQAPGLLDMSAIRNTNTKIILRLPDQSDRELVGKAASLNDNQIYELSRLETGVAAIYQNNWAEAVLCHIYPCNDNQRKYEYIPDEYGKNDIDLEQIIRFLLSPRKFNEQEKRKLENMTYKMNIPAKTKTKIINFLKSGSSMRSLDCAQKIVWDIFQPQQALEIAYLEENNLENRRNALLENLNVDITTWDKNLQNMLVYMIAKENINVQKTNNSLRLFNLLTIETKKGCILC